MNILIVKLSAIGDVVHTLPSLSALRKAFPEAHITWVVEAGASDLLQDHPDCDRVLVSFRKRWVNDLAHCRRIRENLSEARSFIDALRDRVYDIAIDFQGLFKSAVIIGLSRAHRKIGYRSMQELSRFFYNETIPEDMEKHAVMRYLDFVEYLGIPTCEPRFTIAVDEEGRNRVARLLNENEIGERVFVAVSPAALWETKLWDNESFAGLCDRISKELAVPVVFTGAGDDNLIGLISQYMTQDAVDLSGRTSLRELACLYEKAALLVTTDSGPMHIAAAVGTPTVALFGPTSPSRTGPFGDGHTVVRSDISCSPCYLKRCSTMECMMGITDERVFESVKESLASTGVLTPQ
ncbi:MAG: glycosyltransferase family 9 protein [Syntrophales bacterium]|nr:glycosyltransferase family 9 protein [Syntrophales bacterium]